MFDKSRITLNVAFLNLNSNGCNDLKVTLRLLTSCAAWLDWKYLVIYWVI